jgi:hypothetical protein
MRGTFSPDGRAHHVECPPVVCPVCSRTIAPNTPIRRDGEDLVHGNCWIRRYRQRIGVSAPSDGGRIEIVRGRLAAGVLPSAEPTKAWGGISTGSVCLGCASSILAGQIEYEVQFANAVQVRMHRSCYLVWEQERGAVRREISGGSSAASWTLLFDQGIAQRAASERWAVDELLSAAADAMACAVRIRARSRVLEAVSASLSAQHARLA